METVSPWGFVWGFGIGATVALLVVLRWPAFRLWWLGLEFFGHPLIKSNRKGTS